MDSPPKVLIIAYYFPPMGLSGVQRTLKFVKYLPQFGWSPTVLTVTPTGYYAQDYSLLDEIRSNEISIKRVGSLDPNRLFRKKGVVKMPSERWRKILTFISDAVFIPDNKIGWKRKALRAARKLFQEKNFDVIYATAPPFTDFLIGSRLSAEFHKPLVIDYRDPWHDYPYKYYPTPLHRWQNYRLEKKVIHSAARVLTTNRRTKELILKRFKFLNYHDVTILPHGFDPQDFKLPVPVRQRSDKMKIAHAGVFYGDRTPVYLFRALKKVFTDQPSLKDNIEVCFIGTLQDEYRQMIQTMGLGENFTLTGYLDHGQCVSTLVSSDILWLMVNNDRQSPGKLYEYFGTRKPILACVPDGFIRQTIEEAEAGVIVEPTEVDGLAAAIRTLYEKYKSRTLPSPKEEIILKYDRIELTRELSRILGFLVE